MLLGLMAKLDWANALALEMKVAQIIQQQEENGVHFNQQKAKWFEHILTEKITKIDIEAVPQLPPMMVVGTSYKKPFLKSGKYSKYVAEYLGEEDCEKRLVAGPFTKIEYVPFDLGKVEKVKAYLLDSGWKPTEWNSVRDPEVDGGWRRTSPKLTEDSFDTIKGSVPLLVKQRIVWAHRRSQIRGWLYGANKNPSPIRSDGRLPAGANPCGTNTGRMRHRTVVNIPSTNAVFGGEMRSLFEAGYCEGNPRGLIVDGNYVPPNRRVFVGYDASGLELRMLAHYMNDPDYVEAILHGDIHTFNQEMAGLPTRASAKTFIYAFLYGAGDQKIGSIIGGGRREGARIKRTFFKSLPKLERLITGVQKASETGYLIGLDGRKIWMRRDDSGKVMTHKALNTLLQCSGAVVMKVAMCYMDNWLKKEKLDALKVIDMHDEAQWDCHPKDHNRVGDLGVDSIIAAGRYLNLNCPLDGEANYGLNWKHTH